MGGMLCRSKLLNTSHVVLHLTAKLRPQADCIAVEYQAEHDMPRTGGHQSGLPRMNLETLERCSFRDLLNDLGTESSVKSVCR